MTKHANKDRCIAEGKQAQDQGLLADENPYPPNHDEHAFWLEGFNGPAQLVVTEPTDDFHGDQEEIDAEEQHEADKAFDQPHHGHDRELTDEEKAALAELDNE